MIFIIAFVHSLLDLIFPNLPETVYITAFAQTERLERDHVVLVRGRVARRNGMRRRVDYAEVWDDFVGVPDVGGDVAQFFVRE